MACSTTLTQVMESNLIYVVKHVFNVPLPLSNRVEITEFGGRRSFVG